MTHKKPLYKTNLGEAYVGDSLELIEHLPDDSVNLVITSPPFALQRQKEYGNKSQDEYVDWLMKFTAKLFRVLKEDGSFVIDMGGAYQKGKPVRSLYNYKFLIKMCEEQNWFLAEEFFWFNPAKLPSPIEWVNKRKIRVKDAVNTVWWFSKNPYPKANTNNVLTEYSDRMKKLIEDSEKYYKPKKRPSGHDISKGFGNNNGGAIPPNLLSIPNTESNSQYLRLCKENDIKGHPARFPSKLPEFFIKFLTEENDTVLDIFAGSNTTGWIAEQLFRKWISFDSEEKYLAASVFRFLDGELAEKTYREIICNNEANIKLKNSATLFGEQQVGYSAL